MSIWLYNAIEPNPIRHPALTGRYGIDTCIFCNNKMKLLESRNPHKQTYDESFYASVGVEELHFLQVCQQCGWWVVTRDWYYLDTLEQHWSVSRAVPVLKNLDLADIEVPLNDLKEYLLYSIT